MASPVNLHIPENLPSAFENTERRVVGILSYLDILKKELKRFSDTINLRLFAGAGAGVDSHIAFWNAASVLVGDENFIWDNTNKRLGVSIAAPLDKVSIRGNFRADGNDAEEVSIIAQAYATNPVLGANLNLARARGVLTAPASVQSNDTIGRIVFYGHDGAAFKPGALISAQAEFAPGSNDMPMRLGLHVSPNGTIIPVERLRISEDGSTELFKTAITATAPLMIRPVISGDTTGIFPVDADQYITGLYINSKSTATASGTVNAPGTGRIAMRVNHHENQGGSGGSAAILGNVHLNRTSAPGYSEHAAAVGLIHQASPSAAQMVGFGVVGLIYRTGTGEGYAVHAEIQNHAAVSGDQPIGLSIQSQDGGSVRGGTAIKAWGLRGWTNFLRFVDTDGTVRTQINQTGDVVIRQGTPVTLPAIHIICPGDAGPTVQFEGNLGVSSYLFGFPQGNGFAFVNNALTRSMLKVADSPSSGQTAMTLLVNQAGVFIEKTVLLGANGSGPGGANRMLYVNN